MKVLGLSGGLLANMQDSAAALVEDGVILAAAEEERFTRAKHGRGVLPERAARWMIEEYGAPDAIAYHCNGAAWMVERIDDWARRKLGINCEVHLCDHHTTHAASAYLPSPFENANILTMDNSGDGVSTMLAEGKGGEVWPISRIKHPDSLGLFYAMVTDHLGYDWDSDEYSVMGMAAYGNKRTHDHLQKVLTRGVPHWDYTLNSDFVARWRGCKRGKQERIVSDIWESEFGPRRTGPVTQNHMDFAAAAQDLFEEVVTSLVKQLYHETGNRNVVLAGGCALNCRANQAIRELEIVDHLWVQPASADAGAALGAALLVDDAPCVEMTHAALGPDIPGAISREGIKDAARRLVGGEIIGWAQGRMEYGPRALGRRSILALPSAENRTKVGDIKGREEYRPFAPVVPLGQVRSWFDGEGTWSMTQTFNAKPCTVEQAPGIVHEDSTARVQTVTAAENPALYELLTQIGEARECPILLNTSFNVRGQPIVCTANDAIATFYTTPLDALYVGGQVLSKPSRDDIDEINIPGAGFSGRPRK